MRDHSCDQHRMQRELSEDCLARDETGRCLICHADARISHCSRCHDLTLAALDAT